jgi:hypothetical protein
MALRNNGPEAFRDAFLPSSGPGDICPPQCRHDFCCMADRCFALSIIAFHAHWINKYLVDLLEVLYERYHNPIIIGGE